MKQAWKRDGWMDGWIVQAYDSSNNTFLQQSEGGKNDHDVIIPGGYMNYFRDLQ